MARLLGMYGLACGEVVLGTGPPTVGDIDPCHGLGSEISCADPGSDPGTLGPLIPPLIPKPPACGGSDPGSAGSATAKGL